MKNRKREKKEREGKKEKDLFEFWEKFLLSIQDYERMKKDKTESQEQKIFVQ